MTIFLIILSILFAATFSFYQYFYKNNNKTKVNYFLALLRFITILGILLLLINPKIKNTNFEVQKPVLAIAVDNSSSIKELAATKTALFVFNELKDNLDLKNKFDIQNYQFDTDISPADTINFLGNQTNIGQVAKSIDAINRNKTYPTILISDGNQTIGSDYVYSFKKNNKVYPIVLGDTTVFLDLKINQLNVNKYAFQKNKFPVEIFLQYSGSKSLNANFSISQSGKSMISQTINFSETKKTATINVLLPAVNIGLQIFKASITSKEKEKNTYNNSKNFAVDVIDQRTKIAIVSSITHPDLGALKKSIENNAQRKVSILKPSEIGNLSDFNVLILYQPTAEFKSIFENNIKVGINSFVITGTNTDFNFLNQNQNNFVFKMSNQKEDYLATFDSQFNLFDLVNIGFEQLPPLQNAYGTITATGNTSVLLQSKIRNIDTNAPLMVFAENKGKRFAYLFGENSWKWRIQSFVDTNSFEKYDLFIDKTIQFLASNDSKKSLVVNHENFYNSGEALEISAQYFNKNYEFDENAKLTISVINKKTKQSKNYDLLKTNNAFKVNLDGLSAGQYSFSVKELNSKTVYNSFFEILDFDIEKQFVNPNLEKLKAVAQQTEGAVFMPNQLNNLIDKLVKDPNYVALQVANTKSVALIDWKWLLVLICISLAFEWFIRKYNGLL